MRLPRTPRVVLLAGLAMLGCVPNPADAASPAALSREPIAIDVDATDAPRALFHVHLKIPARAGALTLDYPKWIPGTHGPYGPIVNVVGFRVQAEGRPVAWSRDSANVYEVHVTVPPGVTAIDVALDYACTHTGSGPTPASETTSHLFDLEWSDVVVYPKGPAAAALATTATLHLPQGWSYATALPVAASQGNVLTFHPVSLETLVDSPVLAGEHLRTIDLGVVRGVPHFASLAADSPQALAVPDAAVEGWKRVVGEASVLFGGRHYRSYHFLIEQADALTSYGVEHHESSREVFGEAFAGRGLADADVLRANADYLPHEYVHSWVGKYRRPRGMLSPTYQEPMQGDLLWVYEGLTTYLGSMVLAVRSGLLSMDDAKAWLALQVQAVDTPGRRWRPLVDTAIASQTLLGAPSGGSSLRRDVDYYPEGALVWLEVDAIIRQRTGGARSLDDFCRAFFGQQDSGPEVRPYDLGDVVRGLALVAPYDWQKLFDERIYRVSPDPPTRGLEAAGFRTALSPDRPGYQAALESAFGFRSYWYSLGFTVMRTNVVDRVLEGGPAARAGVTSGMVLTAVDGRKYSPEVLGASLARAAADGRPTDLLVEDGGDFRTLRVDYHAGERYLVLERDPSRPDLLSAILAPRATANPQ